MEAFHMETATRYFIALDDGELVKMTDEGFESTGMFVLPVEGAPVASETVSRFARGMANA